MLKTIFFDPEKSELECLQYRCPEYAGLVSEL